MTKYLNLYYPLFIVFTVCKFILHNVYSYDLPDDLVYKKMKYSIFYIYLSNVAYDFSVDDVGMTMFMARSSILVVIILFYKLIIQ